VTVLAHGVGQSQDLPLPLDLVLQAGAATVVISFLGAALLWRHSRLAGGVERRPLGTWWRLPLRLIVLVASGYVVVNAVAGPRGAGNPAAHALFVWLWVGLIPLSIVFGPVWRAVNPLRTLYRAVRLSPAGRRHRRRPQPPTRRAPGGRPDPATAVASPWPAAVALLAFVWFELVAPHRADPLVVGLVLIGYALVQLALAAVHGEEWFARGDCFEVYSSLAARLSPVRWRPLLAGIAADHPAGFGRAAFLAVWWGSTIFDSASGSPWWAGFLQRSGHPLTYASVGLILVCGLVLGGVRGLAGKLDVTNSLITLAHYLTLLVVEGPRGALLLVRQWGWAETVAWNPVLVPSAVAVTQVVLILLGHTLGVLTAHDLALADTPGRPPLATLADELPVVLFMIACTWAGLFLLFVR
jgi:hypothetical protein